MPDFKGNPTILMNTDSDGLLQQEYASCNEFGAQRVAPCGCFQPLGADIPIAAGAVWISPVIEVPDSSRFDIDLYIRVISGNDIIETNVIYIPNLDDPDTNELITIPDRITTTDVNAYHGYGLDTIVHDVQSKIAEHVWAHQAIQVSLECDVGSGCVVRPTLVLTPRT